MRTEEQAWCANEWVKGRQQTQIAHELGTSSSPICSAIARFCTKAGFDIRWGHEYGYDRLDRREVAAMALRRYKGRLVRPGNFDWVYDSIIEEARTEHIWLLRAEGLTLQAIGDRMGISKERVRQRIWKYGRTVQAALRRPRAMAQVVRASHQYNATHPALQAPPPPKKVRLNMSKLTIEIELSEDAAILLDDSISVDLGHNVQILVKRPRGLERINSCVLQIVMDVEGNVHASASENKPVVLEEAHEDRPGEA